MNSWAPIDGGPQCSGKPGCAWNLSMNVWERTPLRFEFLEDWSLPISPAYLAEAKRQTLVADGKLCSATKTVYDYSKRTRRCHSLPLRVQSLSRVCSQSAIIWAIDSS